MDLSFILYLAFVFVMGLIIGSFLNVVIYRIPRGESIIFPGSHCPACGRALRAVDNIPLLSYLWLKGQCRGCHRRISRIYPCVELLTGLLFAAISLKAGPSQEALIEMAFACLIVALVFTDALHHLLPNVITYPAFVFALVATIIRSGWEQQPTEILGFSIIASAPDSEFVPWRAALFGGLLLTTAAPGFWLLDHLDLILFNKYFEWEEMNKEDEAGPAGIEDSDEAEPQSQFWIYGVMVLGLMVGLAWAVAVIKYSPPNPAFYERAYSGLLRASLGALIGSGVIWLLRALYFYMRGIEGMGLGDVKMMAIIGAFLNWQGIFQVLLLGSLLGTFVGIILAVRSRRGLKTALPFGVCLGIASLVAMLTATPFSEWYVGSLR